MFGFGRYVKERFRAHLKSLFGTPEELSYSPSKLDRKVLKYISHDGGYFIELGANDGVSQSNTMLLEEKYGWRGLLIEAIPHKYFECRKNRSETNDFCFAAVVDENFSGKFVELSYGNLMTIPETSQLNKQDHIAVGSRFLRKGEETIVFGAPARTLTSILDEVGAPGLINLFSLDVEGGELSVLKGIDFDRYSFEYILIETFDFEEIKSFLQIHDYEYIEKFTDHDYLFGLKNRSQTN
ncbi:FkbM family methyltransferase [Roseibium album]|uniref:FkbM family methyltransferase n=1 Tax=Roseibium album TaxID=311410 RepID=UPI0024921A42|nr:FkbM family methyltransferase [Roseibium album]